MPEECWKEGKVFRKDGILYKNWPFWNFELREIDYKTRITLNDGPLLSPKKLSKSFVKQKLLVTPIIKAATS